MKTKYNILILGLLLFSFSAEMQAQEKNTFKVMSYNLRFGELATLEELSEYIKKENPDIVALQEVDVNTSRTRAPHQNGKNFISELAFRTGMLSLYGKTIPYAGGYYGIGILSKYPYTSSKCVLLPMPEGAKEQRAVLISEIELANGHVFTFACTHLDYTTSEVRQAQVAYINDLLLQSENPIVLCGDFNARPDSKEIKTDMGEWLQATNTDFTASAKDPKSKIDYIFCYPINKWTIEDTYTPKVQLSDHLPVITTLTLNVE